MTSPVTADERVRRFLLDDYRRTAYSRAGGSKARREMHSLHCPDLHVVDVESDQGVNDTGAMSCALAARIECPHGERITHRHYQWGTLAEFYAELDEMG